jgi:hypothetical protein
MNWLEVNNGAVTAIATAVMAIFTIVLAFVSIFQGKQLKRSVRLASDEFIANHRPKIRVRSIWLVSDIAVGSPITINLIAVNVGGIKAIVTKYAFTTCFVKKGDSIPLSVEDFPVSVVEIEIKRGARYGFKGLSTGQAVTIEEFNSIRTGDMVLYCIGWIRYEDEAENPMQTGFCKAFRIHRQDVLKIHGGFFREQNEDFEYED